MINRKPGVVTGVTTAVIFIALIFIVVNARGGRHRGPDADGRAFYSDDDGKTWFIDDLQKLPPFDHNGKEAVRAAVFRCPGQRPFVAYLQRYSDAARARIAAMTAQNPSLKGVGLFYEPMEVKAPGAKKWISMGSANPSAEYVRVTTAQCPDKTDAPLAVSPAQPDNGASN